MDAKRSTFLSISVLWLLLLCGCGKQTVNGSLDASGAANESAAVYAPPFSDDDFLYAVGWLDDQSILTVLKRNDEEGIYSYACQKNEVLPIRTFKGEIKYISISPNRERILLQVMTPEGDDTLLLDKSGNVILERKLGIGTIANLSWNPTDADKIFLTVTDSSKNEKYFLWGMTEGVLTEQPDLTAQPFWYSQNLFLHTTAFDKDGKNLFLLDDVRPEGEETIINQNVLRYEIEGESVVMITPSDFNPNELLLVYYYPLLIDQGFISIQAIYEQEKILLPELAIAADSTAIFSVMPAEGKDHKLAYSIVQADFVTKSMTTLLAVEALAPIESSPDGKHLLYGDSYQFLVDVAQRKLLKLHD
ncbi:Hypothetical protein Tpal_411 [Trichococcus palustris]|uniref:YqgU-like 6-bladed beta-propeller domain-containing protein n=1 Tax=Trichococcus palustris TaxID=140314 RepID=A0A143Y6Q2_9LACT|nr:hypothetical protein [Trichococcus palustris]CZQ83190.1 Hypothetical protein Tpal_411 [Trichococcus palustris]SFK69232.1 hypothetical protein SAMN04488076_103120 [Trichococcus palustris]